MHIFLYMVPQLLYNMGPMQGVVIRKVDSELKFSFDNSVVKTLNICRKNMLTICEIGD